MNKNGYVKTPYGVFPIQFFCYELPIENEHRDRYCAAWDNQRHVRIMVLDEDALGHSQKLEDLVDAYIVVKSHDKIVYKVRDFERTSHRLLIADIIAGVKKVYGAVWISGRFGEPMLKIVAEMNHKGVLEILEDNRR